MTFHRRTFAFFADKMKAFLVALLFAALVYSVMAIPDPQPEGDEDGAAYAEPEGEPEPEGSTAGASGMSATIMTLAVSMVSYALSK